MKNVVFVISALLMGVSTAQAYCYEPSPPMYRPSKPMTPFCVNEWNNTHTCDEWQINSYYSDLDQYRYEVENYINDLQRYVDDAVDYAQCEIRSLD